MAILLPPTTSLNVVRLTSAAPEPAVRLVNYIEGLETTLGGYDSLRLDAFGFACTGSSYLVGREREADIASGAAARRGHPVVTAAEAIVWTLERLNLRTVAIVAPYPNDLLDAGLRYFAACGVTVSACGRVDLASPDTRGIYALGWRDAARALHGLDLEGADAILFSGTGLATLPAMARCEVGGRAVLSSNACLAARLLDVTGHGAFLDAQLQVTGWRSRLAQALGLNDLNDPVPPAPATSRASATPSI